MSEESNSLKVAIDTNIVISGTISPNSTPRQLIEMWSEEKFEWVMTEEVFEEMRLVLSRKELISKYEIDPLETENLLDNLVVGAEFVSPLSLENLPIHSRDAKDDKFLACAFGGQCNYLISRWREIRSL